METPFVDIHTHLPAQPGQISLYAYDPTEGIDQRGCSIGNMSPSDRESEQESKRASDRPLFSASEPFTCSGGLHVDLRLPDRPYSTGIHPWRAQTQPPESDLLALLRSSITSNTRALGEIGLDFHTAQTPQERQQQRYWFHLQLQEANERRLPVILHTVKAWEEVLALLKNFPQMPVILHGFIGSPQLAKRLLSDGYYLSYGAKAFRSPKTLDALAVTPLDRLFLETDTTPTPDLPALYEQIATTLHLPLAQLRDHIFTNYQRLFNSSLDL